MNTEKYIAEITSWLSPEAKGYFITLNTIKKDKIQFEQELRKLAHRLNDFCFGRAYQRREKQMKIIAGIESGKQDDILHAHLIVDLQHETKRTLFEVDTHIRKHWCAQLGINNIPFGSMVNVQRLGDPKGRISYMVKDTNYWLQNDTLNLVVL